MSLVVADSLTKSYQVGQLTVPAIRGVDFAIQAGSFVCFVGPSGSGKTTLLNMIGCLDPPSSGGLVVAGVDVTTLNHRSAAVFRGGHIGFVFQDFNLIPVLTAYENVEFPLLMVQRWRPEARRDRVRDLLEAVGIAQQADKRPHELSGGQKQRVAVARALVSHPQLVLADEPTANLDHETAYRIIGLMRQLRDQYGCTFVFSTHDSKIMAEAELTFELEDGRLHASGPAEVATQ